MDDEAKAKLRQAIYDDFTTAEAKRVADAAEAERLLEETRLAAQKELEEQKFKRTISSIKSATDILGRDVQIKHDNISSGVIGTILEIKTDGVLFLIVVSDDAKYPEGSVVNLFYKDNLVYKIM